MRSQFTLTLLTAAILLSGCSTKTVPDVGLTQPSAQYDDRMLDSLGSQRYTEQQMLYTRQVQRLEQNLDTLEEKRKALEGAIAMNQVEAGAGKLQASDSEAVRMGDYASATHDAQTRIAKESSQQAVKQALIENDRDRDLMEAELEANRRLAALDRKYGSSIQSAASAGEKARLTSELEAEKAKAEAQRKKAMIEADSTRDVSRLEQDYQSRIASAKRTAAVANSEASQATQSQRIKIALANADAKRRVQTDIATTQDAITGLSTEKQAASQALADEIAKLSERIVTLKGQLAVVQSGFDGKIAVQQSKLNELSRQKGELADVERELINAPVAAISSASGASSAELERLEADLHQAKRDIEVRKAREMANVDQQLSHDLAALAVKLDAASGPAVSGASEVAATDRTASESAIRSELAAKKTKINNEARTQIAQLTVQTEIAKASVVAPVLTSRAVYSGSYGEQPVAFAAKESTAARAIVAKAKQEASAVALAKPAAAQPALKAVSEPQAAPVLVVSNFAPKMPSANAGAVEDVVIASGVMAGGDMKPLVVAPSSTSYTVLYTYAEKGSADKFANFLRAYGIDDFSYRYSEKLGQHVLFMGKFNSKDKAASRVAFLNKTTSTANAKIIETDF